MTTASTSVSAASVGADEDDFGLLAVNWPGPSISGRGHLTRVAAAGTVAVDESRGITGTAQTGDITADPTPTIITGA